jgi:hypothetical protein
MPGPMQQILDAIPMQPVSGVVVDEGMPYATHKGIWNLGDLELEVFRLNDGRTVISDEGMAKFLEWLGA